MFPCRDRGWESGEATPLAEGDGFAALLRTAHGERRVVQLGLHLRAQAAAALRLCPAGGGAEAAGAASAAAAAGTATADRRHLPLAPQGLQVHGGSLGELVGELLQGLGARAGAEIVRRRGGAKAMVHRAERWGTEGIQGASERCGSCCWAYILRERKVRRRAVQTGRGV